MEKRRIRLEINGVVCGLITQESEEYMQSLAGEVGDLMRDIQTASPYITREAAALTAALSYCDDAKKNGEKASALQERVDELEVEAEVWQEEKAGIAKTRSADPAAEEKLKKLEQENAALEASALRAKELEARTAELEEENEALREGLLAAHSAAKEAKQTAGQGEGEIAELKKKLEALEREKEELGRQAEQSVRADGDLPRRVGELEVENDALRRQAEKAEQEKQGAVSAAKRAVEEAKKLVDQLRQELEEAKEDAKHARRLVSAPALSALEKMAEEGGGAREEDRPHRQRHNPLRHDEEFEQEGLISFFEKKDK